MRIIIKKFWKEIESTGRNEVKRGQEKLSDYRKTLLMVHVAGQPEEDVQYWRVVVLDDLGVKSLLVSELHSVPLRSTPWGTTYPRIRSVDISGGVA